MMGLHQKGSDMVRLFKANRFECGIIPSHTPTAIKVVAYPYLLPSYARGSTIDVVSDGL